MKTTVWVVASLAVAFLAYSLAPDFARYMKMRSM